jgi:glutamyl-tRNA synthetase
MAAEVLDAVNAVYETCEWKVDPISDATFAAAESVGVTSKRHAQAPIRVAITGRSVGPPLWDSMVVLGREETRRRIRAARQRLAHGTS